MLFDGGHFQTEEIGVGAISEYPSLLFGRKKPYFCLCRQLVEHNHGGIMMCLACRLIFQFERIKLFRKPHSPLEWQLLLLLRLFGQHL